MHNKKIKIISIAALSTLLVSGTTIGIVEIVKHVNSSNAQNNPIITLDANGGEFNTSGGYSSIISKYVKYDTSWDDYKYNMPTPIKSGFDIKGWEYQKEDKTWQTFDDYKTETGNAYRFVKDTVIRVTGWVGASPNHFATDSWQTIVDVANGVSGAGVSKGLKGLDNLKLTYWSDISNTGTFIIKDYSNQSEVNAKTRSVFLKGIGSYKVRVIGENQDLIYGETNKAASLTFEFEDIVEASQGFDFGSNNYFNSNIDRFLNNQFVYRLPEPINNPEILQKVSKKSYEYVDGSWQINEHSTEVFLPSLSEYGFSNATELNSSSIHENHEVKDENSVYTFYNQNFNSSAHVKKYTDSKGKSIDFPYWTRSSFISNDTTRVKAHAIDSNGRLADDNVTKTKNNGLAPCFCIGKSDVYSLTVNTGDHLSSKHNNFISKNTGTIIDVIDNDLTDKYIAPRVINFADEEGEVTKTFITVTVGGKNLPATEEDQYGSTVTNFTYDFNSQRLVINSEKINGDVVVTINPKESAFYSDSWSTFISNVNNGLDSLATTYKDEYEETQTFVGFIRPVTLNSKNYLVRVIDEQKDYISNEETKVATLTFEFTSSVMTSQFNATKSFKYYFNRIKDDDPSTLKDNVEGLLTGLPTELQTGIVSVKKLINNVDSYGVLQYSDFDAKLFPLSLAEISSDTTYRFGDKDEATAHPLYGNTVYKYYSAATSTDGRRRNKAAELYTDYWLRSASNYGDKSVISISNDYGNELGKDLITTIKNVAPAFCLGSENIPEPPEP